MINEYPALQATATFAVSAVTIVSAQHSTHHQIGKGAR
jgi:hypothetical protein